MLNPPDDLLEDLQSALPPEQQVPTPTPGGNRANGHLNDHFYDRADHEIPERASVASTSTVSPNVCFHCGQVMLSWPKDGHKGSCIVLEHACGLVSWPHVAMSK